jgi:DNA-binding transcriptional regulator/RsmH inhibitor MraZ
MKALTIFILLLTIFFSAAHAYTIFEENGKVGLKNEQGQVLIPAIYEALGWSNGAFSVVENATGYFEKGRWGLINLSNHRLTKAEFEELLPGESNVLIARKKSNLSLRMVYGCINASGKEIIPFLYDGIKVSGLRAIVFTKIGNQYKYGLITLDNKTLIPQQFQQVRSIGTLRYEVRNFEGKTALFSDVGKPITGFTIDSISSFKKNYAILYQGIYKGLINREGEVKIQPIYRDVVIEEDGSLKIKDTDEWFLLDGQNKLIRQMKADSVVALGNNLLKVEISGVAHLADQTLVPISNTTFTGIGKFKGDKALYWWEHYYGILDRKGTIVIPAIYNQLIVGKGWILANQKTASKDAWVLLDSTGVKRTQKTYEQMLPFNGKYFAVKSHGFWGALNEQGREAVNCVYDSLLQIKDDLVVVKFKGQYGIINVKEEWIVTPQKNKLALIGNQRYVEIDSPTTFLKSTEGNTIYFSDNRWEIYPEYLLEYLPSGTIWKVDMNGVITERKIFPAEATEKVFDESEGLRAIKRNGRYGFIDSQGRLRIANRYEAVKPFNEGFAPVKILGKWGFINRQDNIAVQPSYEEVFQFNNGVAVVKQKGLYGLVDSKGRFVLPVRYEAIAVLPDKNVIITQNGLYGLADMQGRTLINPKYNHIQDVENGYVIVQRDGKYGVLTTQGLSTIPLIYDYIFFDTYHKNFMALKTAQWQVVKL